MLADFAANSDLAWLWADGNVHWLVVLVGGAVVVTLGGCARALVARRPPRPNDSSISVPSADPGDHPAGAPDRDVERRSRPEPHYGEAGIGYRAIVHDICQTVSATDAVVNIAPFAYQIPMNWMPGDCKTDIPIYGYA